MWTSFFWQTTVSVSIFLVSVAPAMAQGKGGGGGKGGGKQNGGGQQNQQAMPQIQQIGQQLQEGQRALQKASENATEIRREWQKVDTKHKEDLRELAQAKKFAEEEGKNLPELKVAKEKLDRLRGELAEIRKKVIETLAHDNEDYQKAIQLHAAAIAQQKANSGVDVSAETRQEFVKKTLDADKNKKILEDVALADHTEAKVLVKQIKEADSELEAASKKKADLIERDPKVASAKTAFVRSLDELKKAKANLDQAEGDANRIRSAMQSLANQRAAIQNQLQSQPQTQQQGGNGKQGGKGKSGKR
jgi:chromosome segregation ATPase